MRILALGKPFYSYPKSIASANKVLKSAPKFMGADFFSFKGGSNFEDRASIIASSSPTELERGIEKHTGIKPVETHVKKFQNGEIYVNVAGNVRGKDVYLMPASGDNVNDNLMETYLKADAAKRAGAERVIAVMPNFDYARQEKRTEKGEPIAARLNMDLLRTSGVDEIITEDLHTPAIEGFAGNDMTVTHLESLSVMRDYIASKNISDLVIVSPDAGGMKRAEKLAQALGCDKAMIHKQRKEHNEAIAEYMVGDVNGKNCIIYDDIIDTAGTIAAAAEMLKKNGAKDIYICASHGLFNGKAMQRLNNAPVKEVIVTNSVPAKPSGSNKIHQVDISVQIAEAMRNISSSKV